ncbi:putative Glucan endo-1,3-beta-glucosidase [Melia azedarach]|uniref:Glucan endo-1,3-beta-glucosidase n=1 Tax=Melia azedarach TaxID=155640 RepID=A0ACC1WU66_MELAZ|nr:putative Glucan endo-1,3-beta-glucosidase [Melia azedarach]
MDSTRFRLVSIPFLFIFYFLSPAVVSAFLGINYGLIADNLPPPEKAVLLVQSVGANKVKIFNADPRVIAAFANTGIELIVGLPNEYLKQMQNPDDALAWVTANIQAHLPASKIGCIVVGNEVLTLNDTVLRNFLVPAMQNILTALVQLRLDKQIAVTTTHALNVLESSYPPSSGSFRQDLLADISRIVNFHKQTGSPFLINAYPYFVYRSNPAQVSLDFVLFRSNYQGFADPESHLRYDNMLFAQIDAVYNALASLDARELSVHISETGWPSKGDENEAGATPELAREYNENLIKVVAERKGTPMRPDSDLNVYLFSLYNEDLKPGPTSERNFGLFKPEGKPAYPLSLGQESARNIGGMVYEHPPLLSPDGYYYYDISGYSVGENSHMVVGKLVFFVCLTSVVLVL